MADRMAPLFVENLDLIIGLNSFEIFIETKEGIRLLNGGI